MKRYKLTLIPGNEVFDSLFESKQEASTFVYQYIANHPDDNLTPFDFSLDECEAVATNIDTYDRAISVLGDIDYATISVDSENEAALTALDELLTIARAWNKVDGTTESFHNTNNTRYCPQFSNVTDSNVRSNFRYEKPIGSVQKFGINAMISFRSRNIAKAFSIQFKEDFAKLFNIPYEP